MLFVPPPISQHKQHNLENYLKVWRVCKLEEFFYMKNRRDQNVTTTPQKQEIPQICTANDMKRKPLQSMKIQLTSHQPRKFVAKYNQ